MTPRKLGDQLERLRRQVSALGDAQVSQEVERLTEILLELMEENRDLRVEIDALRSRPISEEATTRDLPDPVSVEPRNRPTRTITIEPAGSDGVVFGISTDGEEPARIQRKGSKAVPVLVAVVECQRRSKAFTSSDIVREAPEAFTKVDPGGRVVPMNASEVSSALRSYVPVVDRWLSDPQIAVGHVTRCGRAQWRFEPIHGSVNWNVKFDKSIDSEHLVSESKEEE